MNDNTADKAAPTKCQYCGGYHRDLVCPRIKLIDYYENGAVKHVEFVEDWFVEKRFVVLPARFAVGFRNR